MHVPDGFLDAPTSIGTGVVAAAAVGVALRGARRELDDRTAPLAGLVAAFVFAAQMLNFPVASGTSGHLLGGALAAILVGPYTGLLCMATVFLVQCLLFADGGLSALGLNVVNMALVTAWTPAGERRRGKREEQHRRAEQGHAELHRVAHPESTTDATGKHRADDEQR
jgi:cobalt/nickel transport system permease protein